MKVRNRIGMFLVLSSLLNNCCNGSGSADSAASPIGTWYCASVTIGGNTSTDVRFIVATDGTFTETYRAGGSFCSIGGTLAPASLPKDTTLTGTITSSSGGPYAPPVSTSYNCYYTNLTSNTVDWYEDFGGGYQGPISFTRVIDAVLPYVVSTNPSGGATGVDPNLIYVSITFSEPMNSGYDVFSTGHWPLSPSTATAWSSDKRTFTISRDDTATIGSGTTVSIFLNQIDHYFSDLAGNPLSTYSFSFIVQ